VHSNFTLAIALEDKTGTLDILLIDNLFFADRRKILDGTESASIYPGSGSCEATLFREAKSEENFQILPQAKQGLLRKLSIRRKNDFFSQK
jgi:hypothetical protein